MNFKNLANHKKAVSKYEQTNYIPQQEGALPG